MTVTHSPVIPVKPVADGHPSARVPAPGADVARPSGLGAGISLGTTVAPTPAYADSAAHQALVYARTATVMRWSFAVARVVAVVGLITLAYLAVSGNWVGNTADALVAWYHATISPYLAIDLTPTHVPTLYDGVFGPIPQPLVVIAD